jgi:hypothetical protein
MKNQKDDRRKKTEKAKRREKGRRQKSKKQARRRCLRHGIDGGKEESDCVQHCGFPQRP